MSFYNNLSNFGRFQQRVGGYILIACMVMFGVLGIFALFKKQEKGSRVKLSLSFSALAAVFGLGAYMSFMMAKNTSSIGKMYLAGSALSTLSPF